MRSCFLFLVSVVIRSLFTSSAYLITESALRCVLYRHIYMQLWSTDIISLLLFYPYYPPVSITLRPAYFEKFLVYKALFFTRLEIIIISICMQFEITYNLHISAKAPITWLGTAYIACCYTLALSNRSAALPLASRDFSRDLLPKEKAGSHELCATKRQEVKIKWRQVLMMDERTCSFFCW